MNEKISNKLAFNIYVWTTFLLFIIMFVYVVLILIGFGYGNKELIQQLKGYIIIGPIFAVIGSLFDHVIKPAYFEATITSSQITIKSFNPNIRNGTRFILMLFCRKYITEYHLSRQSFNNYKIQIARFGFKRNLILQKIENGQIYESKPINISFLGIRKYTGLIISIERLKEKITVN